MTTAEYKLTDSELERIAEMMMQKKYNKTEFYKIIDEFNDDLSAFDNSRGDAKKAISALARVHFDIRTPTGFKPCQADELRQFIRDIVNYIIKNRPDSANIGNGQAHTK